MKISEAIRQAIRRSALSRNAIAVASGVPAPVIYRFVSGKRDIRLATAEKLMDVLGLIIEKERL